MTQRVAIIGVGLAGVLLGKALSEAGAEVAYFGSKDDAQWHPAALVHPFPGRSLALSKEVCAAIEVVDRWMKTDLPGRSVWVERPIAPESRERRTYESNRDDYPSWLEHHFDGDILRYRPGWVVDMTLIPSPEVISESADWVECGTKPLVSARGTRTPFDAVVVCPGRSLGDWWMIASVEQGGEAVLSSRNVQPEDVVSCGSAHRLPWRGGMALSKSFLTPGQIRSDQEVLEDFGERSGLELAGSEVWRGIRCISGDRQPVCGRIRPNVYLFGALGARGLLLGPLLAEKLADLVLHGENRIPAIYASERFSGSLGPRLREVKT